MHAGDDDDLLGDYLMIDSSNDWMGGPAKLADAQLQFGGGAASQDQWQGSAWADTMNSQVFYYKMQSGDPSMMDASMPSGGKNHSDDSNQEHGEHSPTAGSRDISPIPTTHSSKKVAHGIDGEYFAAEEMVNETVASSATLSKICDSLDRSGSDGAKGPRTDPNDHVLEGSGAVASLLGSMLEFHRPGPEADGAKPGGSASEQPAKGPPSPQTVLLRQLQQLRSVMLMLKGKHEQEREELSRLRIIARTSQESAESADAAADSLRSTIQSLQEERDSLRACLEDQTALQSQVLRARAAASQQEGLLREAKARQAGLLSDISGLEGTVQHLEQKLALAQRSAKAAHGSSSEASARQEQLGRGLQEATGRASAAEREMGRLKGELEQGRQAHHELQQRLAESYKEASRLREQFNDDEVGAAGKHARSGEVERLRAELEQARASAAAERRKYVQLTDQIKRARRQAMKGKKKAGSYA